ncbi:MAG: type I restriction-modification system subunit M N-terminal domain-containing protein [Chitinophagales bacterium]
MTSAAQRTELQNKIWKIANDLRGSVDGWDFKQFVLGTFLPVYQRKLYELYRSRR